MPKLENADKTPFCHLFELTIFRTLKLTTTRLQVVLLQKQLRHEKTHKII